MNYLNLESRLLEELPENIRDKTSGEYNRAGK